MYIHIHHTCIHVHIHVHVYVNKYTKMSEFLVSFEACAKLAQKW